MRNLYQYLSESLFELPINYRLHAKLGDQLLHLEVIGRGYFSTAFLDLYTKTVLIITRDPARIKLARSRIKDRLLPKSKIIGTYLEEDAGRFTVIKMEYLYEVSDKNNWKVNLLASVGNDTPAIAYEEFLELVSFGEVAGYELTKAEKEFAYDILSFLKKLKKIFSKTYFDGVLHRMPILDFKPDNIKETKAGNIVIFDPIFYA